MKFFDALEQAKKKDADFNFRLTDKWFLDKLLS